MDFNPLVLAQSAYEWNRWGMWHWFFSGSLLFGIISWFVGNTRGNGCLGCILGLLLGPFGLLITVLVPRK